MEKRVKFDFEVFFTNGGSVNGEDFRLDIEGNDISDKELADYIIQDMRLLMAGKTVISNKVIFEEAHKRKTGTATDSGKDNAQTTTDLTSPAGIRGNQGQPVYIDLSHTIENGLITYKGLPAPIICDYLSREDSKKFYDEGTSFQIGKIEMVTNTGTYIDCPFHRYEHGKDLSEVSIDSFADLEGIVIHVPHTETMAITADHLRGHEIRKRAVLIHTGWDIHWNTENYFDNHPFLTQDAAAYLRDCQVKLVGIDSHNIDDTRDKNRPVHTILLGDEILIVEHLCNLQLLPNEGFTFSAIPPKFKGAGTFPVRAMATLRGAIKPENEGR